MFEIEHCQYEKKLTTKEKMTTGQRVRLTINVVLIIVIYALLIHGAYKSILSNKQVSNPGDLSCTEKELMYTK